MLRSVLFTVAVVGWSAPSLWATHVTIPIDKGMSTIIGTLCVVGECDTDSSNVTGAIEVSLDDGDVPTEITLHDFDLFLTSTLNYHIVLYFGPFPIGTLDATVANLSLHYAEPGTPFGPVPLIGDGFSWIGVPTDMLGVISYTASDAMCTLMKGMGVPCVGTIDLGTLGTQNADLGGTLTVQDGIATITFSPDVTVPIDPDNPDLGNVTITGTITGSAALPVKGTGDFDEDNDVDLSDFAAFQTCFSGDAPYGAGCAQGDFNADGVIDASDLADFAGALSGP